MTWRLLLAIGHRRADRRAASSCCCARGPSTCVLGLTLLSYAVNLFIFAIGPPGRGPARRSSDRACDAGHYADPLPQALVLTAIVIGFA